MIGHFFSRTGNINHQLLSSRLKKERMKKNEWVLLIKGKLPGSVLCLVAFSILRNRLPPRKQICFCFRVRKSMVPIYLQEFLPVFISSLNVLWFPFLLLKFWQLKMVSWIMFFSKFSSEEFWIIVGCLLCSDIFFLSETFQQNPRIEWLCLEFKICEDDCKKQGLIHRVNYVINYRKKRYLNWCFVFIHQEQDMTQGQFLNGVDQVWI